MSEEISINSIKISKTDKSRLSEVDFNNMVFGRQFADHMLVADYHDGRWVSAEIMPFQNLTMHPAMTALHYGQSIFEGMKAYKDESGRPLLFRPEDNFNRLNASARRMCMAEVPREIFMDGLFELIKLDQDWIPTKKGSALYIRPYMFGTDEYVGIKPSDNYRFIMFTSPVGAYYPEPVGVKIEEYYTRAAEGGVGAAKCAGNYGASLLPNLKAIEEGYRQLIWTDAKEHKYIEESGTMNIFFRVGDKIITPGIERDTILKGITRDSAIKIARDLGIEVEERQVLVEEIVEAYDRGELHEVFGTGTAATIAQVSSIGYREKSMPLPPVAEREYSNAILDRLDNIRMARVEDPYGWVITV